MSELQTIIAPRAAMLGAPESGAEQWNELLFGEFVQVLEVHGAYFKVKALHDGYEGYVLRAAMQKLSRTSTHRICAPLTHLYTEPDFKTAVKSDLYFYSAMNIKGAEKNGFLQTDGGDWIFSKHVLAIDSKLPDHTETAHMFLNAPYVWGGRSVNGLDCSALVQLSVNAAGKPCARDTKDQIKTLGREIGRGELRRGDFVFFERHVGIMLDQTQALNATARHMKVVIEPLEVLESAYNGLKAVRRL